MNDAYHSILGLMNRYCFSIDAGDLEAFAGLFEHGSLEIAGDPAGALHGKERVMDMVRNVALYDGKPHTRHVMSNVQIDVDESAGTATAQSYLTVFQALPDFPLQPIFIGHYFDRFTRTGTQWRFAERRIEPQLMGDMSRHRPDMAG